MHVLFSVLDVFMRLSLEHLDVRGLALQPGSDEQRVVLASATGLQGTLLQDGHRLEVRDGVAQRAEIATLHLVPGATLLSAESGLVLEDVRGEFSREGDAVACELRGTAARCPRLRVRVGAVDVSGRVELSNVRLRIDGAEGAVFGERLVLADVELAIGDIRARIERIEGVHVAIGWGADGFRLDAVSIDLASAAVDAPLALEPAAERAASPGTRSVLTLEDVLPLLDGVSGDINVDLALDLTVPVLGRRRATHRFRIPISDGTIDYMRLENDLSTLENALLDFAMRDGALVLEMGIPFIPTRGLGKPILRWDMAGDDLALAQRQRIRVSMLPRFRMASEGEGGEKGKSSVALRQLELRSLEAGLRLQHDAPPERLPLHRIAELAVAGHLYHAPGAAPRDGLVRARIAGVELGAMALPLDSAALGWSGVTLELVDPVEVAFTGIAAQRVQLALRGLVVSGAQVRTAPADRGSATRDRGDASATATPG